MHNTSYLVHLELCVSLEEVVDSDVAGWGVITAFTAAIVLNLSAIVAGYFLIALPENQGQSRYNEVDHLFLNMLGIHNPNIPATREDPSVLEANSASHDDITTKGKWTRALESLVMGMSDQQLFTGMALIIPTLLMTAGLHGLNESLSVYSFKVVTMLAYFSFIIQLCSLTVVPNDAKEHKYLRYFRAVMMMIFLILLIFCMFIAESVTFRFNSNVSVKCALQHLRMVDPQRPGYTNVSDEAIILFNLVVLIGVIGFGYYRRMAELFKRRQADNNQGEAGNGQQKTDCFAEFERMFWKYLGLEHFQSSFLSEIIWMLFYFVFGLANLCKFLIDELADISAIEPGFGQLVPILLLAHPFLSAWEALSSSDFRKNRTSTLQQQTPPTLRTKVTLFFVVFVYTSILIIWALVFAALIPGAYPLSVIAVLYTVAIYGPKLWNSLTELIYHSEST